MSGVCFVFGRLLSPTARKKRLQYTGWARRRQGGIERAASTATTGVAVVAACMLSRKLPRLGLGPSVVGWLATRTR